MYAIWCVGSVVVFGMIVFFGPQCPMPLGLGLEASSTPPVLKCQATVLSMVNFSKKISQETNYHDVQVYDFATPGSAVVLAYVPEATAEPGVANLQIQSVTTEDLDKRRNDFTLIVVGTSVNYQKFNIFG